MDAKATVPDALTPPSIMHGYELWYEDFWSLNSERQIGMVAGPIPDSAIDRKVEGMNYVDADAFRLCVYEMDAAWRGIIDGRDNTEPKSAMEQFRDATKGRRK